MSLKVAAQFRRSGGSRKEKWARGEGSDRMDRWLNDEDVYVDCGEDER